MRPLILEFVEEAIEQPLDLSTVVYDEKFNLSLDSRTGRPAIRHLSHSTETFTRKLEDSDSDQKTGLSDLLATETETKTNEDSDSDPSPLAALMATETITIAKDECADSDVEAPPEMQE